LFIIEPVFLSLSVFFNVIYRGIEKEALVFFFFLYFFCFLFDKLFALQMISIYCIFQLKGHTLLKRFD